MLRSLFVLLLLVVAPAGSALAQSAGFGVSRFSPGFDECLDACNQVVIGVASEVREKRFEEMDGTNAIPRKMCHVTCSLEISETLLGPAAKGQVRLEQLRPDSLMTWTPRNGESYVMYLRPGPAKGFLLGNVFFGQRIEGPEDPFAVAVREICSIRSLRSIDEQAREVERCCLSTNTALQYWALNTLVGTGKHREIHEHVSRDQRIAVLKKACFARKHHLGLISFFDEQLQGDDEYARSGERYEMFWGMLSDCLVENEIAGHNEFSRLAGRLLPKHFQNRADDCLTRLAELAIEPDWPFRHSALVFMREFYPSASPEMQGKVIGFAESQLEEPPANDGAATLIGHLAEREAALQGEVSPRLRSILARADSFGSPVRDRLRYSLGKIEEKLRK